MWGDICGHQCSRLPWSVRRSLPSSSSQWGSTPASYSTRSGRKLSSSQGRWASTVENIIRHATYKTQILNSVFITAWVNLPVERYSLSSSPSSTLISRSLCCLRRGKFFPQCTENVNTHGSSLKMNAVPSPYWMQKQKKDIDCEKNVRKTYFCDIVLMLQS